ncbi:MAG TPA: alpha/beta hydrolase [Anaerolineales bacterium]|nr:alpha/beta hydrolase [Anaerolineales bacterium]
MSPGKTLSRTALLSDPVPHFDYGGDGRALHFLHANGYPPACYRPLFDRLAAQFHVFGMLLRPLWPGSDPSVLRDWKPFTEDLRYFLASGNDSPVIGVGHSIGAVVTLRAAIQEPSLFGALILIDPVLLPPRRIVQLRVMRALGLGRRTNRMVQAALRRRRRFDSLEQLFAGYRRRDIFHYFSDEHLRVLIDGLTRPTADGAFELVYSPEWEARIYETSIWNDADLWNGIGSLLMPMLFLRGDETDTFFATTADMVQKKNPHTRIASVPRATHLLPMERPDVVAAAIEEFLDASAVEHADVHVPAKGKR